MPVWCETDQTFGEIPLCGVRICVSTRDRTDFSLGWAILNNGYSTKLPLSMRGQGTNKIIQEMKDIFEKMNKIMHCIEGQYRDSTAGAPCRGLLFFIRDSKIILHYDWIRDCEKAIFLR